MHDSHAETETAGGESPLPLRGVRILDLTHALAGPFATMVLGDLGAEVLKVESPRGDMTRSTPPIYVNDLSLYFLANNRNKRSIVINLKDPDGMAVFHDLVRIADAVIYNYSNGVAERLGITHEDLAKVNSRIVTVSITGFGARGEEADRPAVDLIAQAMSGVMGMTGEPGRPPVRCGVATADIPTGMYAAIGLLAALQSRHRTGKGMKVETSLFHGQLSLLNYDAAFTLHTGREFGPQGSGHVGNALAQAFPTKDGWMVIDAGFNHHFVELCNAVGRPDLAENPRWRERAGRSADREELTEAISEALRAQTTAHWMEILAPKQIPCAPVNSTSQGLRHPQARAQESVRPIEFQGQEFELLATPLWFDDALRHPMETPPLQGEQTREILEQELAYDADQVARLVDSGAVMDEYTVEARGLKGVVKR